MPQRARLVDVDLPAFGIPEQEPRLPEALYDQRLARVRNLMRRDGLDALVVYGDREHTANLTYLCGFDPRFEEALLVVKQDGTPTLMVGNEGWGYAELTAHGVSRTLYQTLSLLGQPRDRSVDLRALLSDAGLEAGSMIGVAGWKYFSSDEFDDPAHTFEVPSYLVDELRDLAGSGARVVNAGALFMNPVDGLRILNEAEQLAWFEYAACHTSEGLKRVLFGMQPDMTEQEAASLMGVNGIPTGAHLMLTSGPRAAYGLPSPSTDRLHVGDRFTMALCYWGALNARAGWLVHDASELPDGVDDYLDRLAIPYFEAVAAWYEHIGIGTTGGELYDIIYDHLGDPFFGLFLNPGHYIHLDEWVHSPVFKGSEIEIQSGMALQVDVIPATGTDYHTINIEDGIAIADEALRRNLADRFPDMWRRVEQRRRFMKDVLGIHLKPEVLPLGNIPAYLPPFMLSPRRVLSRR